MEEKKIVNEVVSELSKINDAASRYAEDLENAKKEIEAKYQQDKESYADKLESDEASRMEQLKEKLEEQNQAKIAELKNRHGRYIEELNESYEKNHTAWAKEIADKIIAERL